MLRLAKAFLNIALWRQTPADLPASLLLLALAAGTAALTEVLGALLPLARRRERFLQTGTALMGVGALAAVLLYPLASLTGVLGDQKLSTALLIGYLLACAHIWRSALDSSFLLGVIISFGYFIFSISVSRQVLLQS